MVLRPPTILSVLGLVALTTASPEYIGCYADEDDRDLPHNLAASVTSVSMCAAACGCKYSYAGVQYGSECWCGDNYGSYGESSACTMSCADGETGCGGAFSNSIYAVGSSDCAAVPCSSPEASNYPWCDPALDTSFRVSALVANLTTEEKAGLLVNGASGVSRLDIPPYNWWSEALHGVARDGLATSFPQIIGVGSSFNDSLWQALGEMTSTEARGKNNDRTSSDIYQGLTLWSPNVNIFRDPRWGRGQETPGEDPTINGNYGIAYVTGLQGDEATSGYLRTSACLKHFAAYSEETDRMSFAAVVTNQDMQDMYTPAFEAGVTEGKASCVMCSYNAETFGEGLFGNGTAEQEGAIPSCANHGILNGLIRDQWGFNGYVTSDCGAVDGVENSHEYTDDAVDTIKAVLYAGVDTDCGSYMSSETLLPLLESGAVEIERINTALTNLFTTQFRLGFFDAPNVNIYGQIDESVVNTPSNQVSKLFWLGTVAP